MTITDLIHEPIIVGMATFLIGVLVLAAVMAVTSTRRWHDRHHQNRSELMCDHCLDRRHTNPDNAPRMRVLGERRW